MNIMRQLKFNKNLIVKQKLLKEYVTLLLTEDIHDVRDSISDALNITFLFVLLAALIAPSMSVLGISIMSLELILGVVFAGIELLNWDKNENDEYTWEPNKINITLALIGLGAVKIFGAFVKSAGGVESISAFTEVDLFRSAGVLAFFGDAVSLIFDKFSNNPPNNQQVINDAVKVIKVTAKTDNQKISDVELYEVTETANEAIAAVKNIQQKVSESGMAAINLLSKDISKEEIEIAKRAVQKIAQKKEINLNKVKQKINNTNKKDSSLFKAGIFDSMKTKFEKGVFSKGGMN